MVEGYQLKSCSRFNRAGALLQCFNGCQYGHISSRCTGSTKCGTCTGNHNTREHQGPAIATPNCVTCGKEGHTAWHPDCRIRQKEKERAQAKKAGMASKYAVKPIFEQNRLPTAALVNFDEEGFQSVTRKRKRTWKSHRVIRRCSS